MTGAHSFEVTGADMSYGAAFGVVARLCGKKADGSHWGPLTPQQVAERIMAGERFFVRDPNGREVDLHPHQRDEHGTTRHYVSTLPDKFTEDNLVNLPKCP
jgi:hypothetical protein